MTGRQAEIAHRLAAVRARISAACAAAGRDPDEITLIAVTKTYPASDVLALARLGVRDFGENRDQEAALKAAEVAAAPVGGLAGGVLADGGGLAAGSQAPEVPDAPLTWHFIGQLQTNKARSVAGYAGFVHSVDRVRLVTALGRAARAAGRRLTCLVQVSLDPQAGPGPGSGSGAGRDAGAGPGAAPDPQARGPLARGGVPPAGLAEVAAAIKAAEGLTLGGLMAVAPLGADPGRAFAPLRDLSAVVRSVDPSATVISAGMSGDLEAAVVNGATHLRIGTALLGNRRLPVR